MEKEVVMFADIVKGTFRRWKLVLSVIVIAILMAVGIGFATKPTEKITGTTKVYINEKVEQSLIVNSKNMIPTYIELLKSRGFIEDVLSTLNYNLKYQAVLGNLDVKLVSNTNFIIIQYSGSTKEEVTDVLNSIVNKLSLAVNDFGVDSTVDIVDELNIVVSTEGVSKVKLIILALIGGTLLGFGLSFVLECINRTYRTKGELERDLEVNALAMLPRSKKNKGLINFSADSIEKEAYNSLAIKIRKSVNGKENNIFAITSSIKEEGVTTVASNLALSLSTRNNRVLLIDYNFDNKIANNFGIESKEGIVDIIINNKNIDNSISKYNESLDILLAGKDSKNSLEVLESAEFKRIINELREKYDFIIIDTPALHTVSDSQLISTIADNVILVVRAEKVNKSLVKSSLELLNELKANVTGVVLSSADTFRNKFY